MASTSQISGLSSGLDTATIISQLMTIEAQPQTNLKTAMSAEQSVTAKLQALNAKGAALATTAGDLAKPAAWQAVTASSSQSAVRVTATATATATRLSVTVTAVAKTHQLGFSSAAALTDQVTGASNAVTLTKHDGSTVSLDTGDGTLQGLVKAINSAANDTGLHATAVRSAEGYRLLVESDETGGTQDFTLTAADGSALLGGATIRAGADASIDLGTGITATSSTNTFTDLVPGVTLTLGSDAAVGTTATVAVTKDTAKLSASVKAMVDAMNGLQSDISTQTAYNATTKTSGALAGDAAVRSLSNSLGASVFGTSGRSLATVGIQTNRDGTIAFDATAFASAYAADPAGTEALFTSTAHGFADRVAQVAKSASDPTTGTLTSAITGHNSSITRTQKSIDDWTTRLTAKQESLERQYTALETALNTLNSQSSWLAGQISSLSSSSS